MCKHLNYALQYFSNSINVYLLDGGDNKPYSYSFEKSIPINNSTTIEAMPNRRFYPRIWQKDNPWVYIFEVRSTCEKLKLRRINFTDSFIALINQGELIIDECDVSFSLYAPRSSLIYLWQDIRAAVLLVQITNSKFDQSYYILDVSTFFQHNITVHITNSTLISSRISFELAKDEGCNSNVNIVTNNTTIAEPKAFHSLCISDGRHGNLLRLVKKECPYNGTGKSVIQILNTTFTDTTNIPIYVHGNVSVHINNSCFRNYKCGGIFLENDQTFISYSDFIVNSRSNYPPSFGAIMCESCEALLVSNTNIRTIAEGKSSGLNIAGEDREVDITLQNVSVKGPGTLVYSTNMKSNFFFDNVNVSSISLNDAQVLIMAYNNLSINQFRLNCFINHKLVYDKRVKYYSFWNCNACPRDTYSTDSGYEIIKKDKPYQNKITCLKCPLGVECNYGVNARPNFWCYKKNGKIICIPCLPGYCCSKSNGSTCPSFNSCNANRKGDICGSCIENYHLNFFSNDCFPVESCKTYWIFWSGFFIAALCYIAFVAYLKDIVSKVKYLFNKCCCCCGENEPENIVKNCEDDDDNSAGRFYGVFKISVSFYQVGALLRVKCIHRTDVLIVHTYLLSLFNLKIEQFIEYFHRFCPYSGLDTVGKMFIRNVWFPSLMLIVLGILLASLTKRSRKKRQQVQEYEQIPETPIKRIDSKIPKLEKIPFQLRVKYCVLQVLLLSYTNIAAFSMNMWNCKSVEEGKSVLYVQGTTPCRTTAQYIVLIFFILWVLPFGLAIYGAVLLFKECYITLNEFICCFLFPPSVLYFGMRRLIKKHKVQITKNDARLSKYIITAFEAPFRKVEKKGRHVIWDPMIIYQRFIIIAITIFSVNAIERLSYILGPMLVFLVDHLRQRPYKDVVLHWMQSIAFVCLCFLVGVNSFWAFLYISSVPYESSIRNVGNVFSYVESLVFMLPLFAIMVYLILEAIQTISKKIKERVKNVIYKMCREINRF
ncbi:uncharacterized protein LOC130645257 isoform X2 [Hydractinia symbiolongicarpus]|nr:uncharacterized protein LOC130645257 isoform X2 [Hydractinia symbiolongicarpus]